MGNKGKQSSSSSQSSSSYSNSYSTSRTDSRSYQNTDSRSYQNVDSRDMSTNVNNVDNRNISETALDCGVSPSDVENYTNDESININQDNSQNIIVSGDGNTLSNITQKMNLTSYGPSVQKCMQNAVNKMASNNKTDLSAESSNETGTTASSDNTSANKSANTSDNTSSNSTEQKSDSSQTSSQGNTQKSSSKQTAGFMSGSGGNDFLIIVLILLIAGYLLYPNKFTQLENNYKLQIVLIIYTISYFLM